MAANVGTVNVTLLISRCKTCKWWSGEDAEYPRQCTHPRMGKLGADDSASDSYGDGYLVTGPDFGCVHWEELKCTSMLTQLHFVRP